MLVGRDGEQERLQRHVAAVAAGAGAVVLLSGEPGIGKSRLATVAADLAAQRGFRIAWGRCWETGGAPAFWPWSQVFEALGVADPFPADAAALDAREARFRCLEQASRALREAAAATPIALVLDDLHAADVPSLDLLLVVARDVARARLLVVGTYRDVEARGGDAAAPLARVGRTADVMALGRLRDADVRAWIDAEVPDTPAATVADVYALTEGNPLFVREVLRARRHIDARQLPVGLQAILDEHVARVDAGTRELLARASVLGRELAVAEVAALAELELDAAAAGLDRACAVGLVEPRGRDRYAFAHVLVRDRLYAALAPSQRGALHRRVGELLLRAQPSRAAHHLIEGHDGGDPARAAEVAATGARAALGRWAFDDAARLAARALELPGIADAAGCELEIVRGEALLGAGDAAGGLATCRSAVDRARRLASPPLLARAALAAAAQRTSGRSDPAMVALLREALAVLPASDDVVRARAQARLAGALTPMTADTYEDAMALARDAIAMARRLGDDDTLRYTLAHGLTVLYYYVANDERHALVDEAARLATDASPLYMDAVIAFDLQARGDLAGADRAFERLEAKITELALADYAWQLPITRAARALLAGDLAAAERLGGEARTIAARGQTQIEIAFALQAISLAQARGEPASVGTRTDELVRVLPRQFAGWVYAATGRTAEATAAYADMQFLRGVDPRLLLAADAAVILGDTALAARCYEPLLAVRSERVLFWAGPIGSTAIGPPARFAGAIAELLGHVDEARALYDEAIAIADAMAAVPHAALARRARERLGAAPTRPRAAATATATATAAATLARTGETWTLGFAGRSHTLKARRGLDYLAQLVEHPRRDVHVLELSGGDAAGGTAAGAGAPLLDAKAKAAYRERVDALREAIDDAEARNDLGRASRARAELDTIASELSRAVGLGGRDRTTATAADRARSAVTLAIRRAIEAIAAAEPALGGHLQAAIRTGQFCSYEPDPTAGLRWRVQR